MSGREGEGNDERHEDGTAVTLRYLARAVADVARTPCSPQLWQSIGGRKELSPTGRVNYGPWGGLPCYTTKQLQQRRWLYTSPRWLPRDDGVPPYEGWSPRYGWWSDLSWYRRQSDRCIGYCVRPQTDYTAPDPRDECG